MDRFLMVRRPPRSTQRVAVRSQVRRVGGLAGLGADLGQHTHGLDGLSSHQPLLFRVHDCLGKIHPLRSDRQLLRLILATRPGKLQIQRAPNGGRYELFYAQQTLTRFALQYD